MYRNLPRCLKYVGLSCICLLFLGAGCIAFIRLALPSKQCWSLLPFWKESLFCQNPIFWISGRTYAREDVVRALKRSSYIVDNWAPQANIAYLDASARKGGQLLGHLSHKSGVDVDILYVAKTKKGELYPQRPSMVTFGYSQNFKQNGRCGQLIFARKVNLLLVLALLKQNQCRVEMIFVEPYIEEWLIETGKDMDISSSKIKKLRSVLRFAGENASKHDDHMHVRFAD